jgi:hypothetical protein
MTAIAVALATSGHAGGTFGPKATLTVSGGPAVAGTFSFSYVADDSTTAVTAAVLVAAGDTDAVVAGKIATALGAGAAAAAAKVILTLTGGVEFKSFDTPTFVATPVAPAGGAGAVVPTPAVPAAGAPRVAGATPGSKGLYAPGTLPTDYIAADTFPETAAALTPALVPASGGG